jgi:HTH-type transcriptional regulator/antitoxin HipB
MGNQMARTTIGEVKKGHLAAMTTDERVVFDETDGATRLALDVGEKIRDAREAANLSQRELAARMRIGQAAVARLEAGDVGAKLATIQKVATALHLRITVELSTSS